MTTTELDDATLVGRARDGDVRAYEQLVLRYQVPMLRLAVKMLNHRGDAEGVVQEVFLGAWRKLAQLQDDSAFVAWLYCSMAIRCLNVIRARRLQADVDLELAEWPRTDGQPEHAVQANGQLEALNAALQQLTPQQRGCWLLRDVHGRAPTTRSPRSSG